MQVEKNVDHVWSILKGYLFIDKWYDRLIYTIRMNIIFCYIQGCDYFEELQKRLQNAIHSWYSKFVFLSLTSAQILNGSQYIVQIFHFS